MTVFLLFVIVIILLIFISQINAKKKGIAELKAQNQELTVSNVNLTATNQNLYHTVTDLNLQVSSLSKYQGIVDTEKKANEILEEADHNAKLIISAAENYKLNILNDETKIRTEAQDVLNTAKNQSKLLIEQAQVNLDSSVNESANIIEHAEVKAVEIAGSAYEAMKNADEYQKTAAAMKNIIKGYGDEYLKPTFSLLDDLAEEFEHTEAGQQLKIARDRNNSLVRTERPPNVNM